MGYDYIFDNLYILALPPQANQTVDTDVNAFTPQLPRERWNSEYTCDGHLTTPAAARAVTIALTSRIRKFPIR